MPACTAEDLDWQSVSPGRWKHEPGDGTLFTLVRERRTSTGQWWILDRCRGPNPALFWISPTDHPTFDHVIAEANRIVNNEGR